MNASTVAQKTESFFTRPASPRPLAALRILLSGVLLVQAFLLLPDLYELYGSQGLLQGPLNHLLIPVLSPCVSWFEFFLAPLGVSTNQTVGFIFVSYVGSLGTLLVGYRTRLSAALVWFLHFTLLYCTGSVSAYGVDSFAHIFLFYFLFIPVGAVWSIDDTKGRSQLPAQYYRLALRILQLHLCLSYFVAGVAKGAGIQWQNGEAIWRATMMPDFAAMNMSWLSHAPWLAKIVAWGTVFFEVTYPIFIWPRRTRPIWLAAIISMHLGIFFVMGLKIFAALMIALNLALFAVPEKWEAEDLSAS